VVSPVITNFFKEDYEEVAHSRAAFKPTCCFHYMDDIFMRAEELP